MVSFFNFIFISTSTTCLYLQFHYNLLYPFFDIIFISYSYPSFFLVNTRYSIKFVSSLNIKTNSNAKMHQSMISLFAFASAAMAAQYDVVVGGSGLSFVPNALTVQVGDTYVIPCTLTTSCKVTNPDLELNSNSSATTASHKVPTRTHVSPLNMRLSSLVSFKVQTHQAMMLYVSFSSSTNEHDADQNDL